MRIYIPSFFIALYFISFHFISTSHSVIMASLFRTRLSHFSLFFTILFFFFIFFVSRSCSTTFSRSPSSTSTDDGDDIGEGVDLKLLQSQCLAVPSSVFITSLKSTIDVLKGTMSVVSQFAKVFDDFRLSNAISDCLDLLDFSADDLTWSLSAIQNPKGTLILFLLSFWLSSSSGSVDEVGR